MRYIGVDHHKYFSYICIKDESGKVIREGKVVNRKDEVKRFLEVGLDDKAKAVLEAGPNWTVMYDWLEEETDEVKLAHPSKVRLIAEAKIKTDKIDGNTLSDLLRCDLIPQAYVPTKKARKIKNILRQRMFFVRVRTMVKNRIQMILDRYPEIRQNFKGTDLFGTLGRKWLGEIRLSCDDERLLREELRLLEKLDELITTSDGLVEKLGKKDKRVLRLMAIPEIGKFFALLIVYEIGDIKRFRNEKKLHSYVGLVPSTYASGNKIFHGRITRQGNKWLRWAFIEAVWPAIRSDFSLKGYYEKIKTRKGANPAKVATARRLLTIVYRVLSQGREYRKDFSDCPHFSLVGLK